MTPSSYIRLAFPAIEHAAPNRFRIGLRLPAGLQLLVAGDALELFSWRWCRYWRYTPVRRSAPPRCRDTLGSRYGYPER